MKIVDRSMHASEIERANKIYVMGMIAEGLNHELDCSAFIANAGVVCSNHMSPEGRGERR